LSFLLDTNAVSEPGRPIPDPGFMTWLAGVEGSQLYLSAITLGELRRGIALIADDARRQRLEGLNSNILLRFGGQVLPIDDQVARAWGDLSAHLKRTGRVIGALDELIAATAVAHDLTLVTRNTRHFDGVGCPLLSPWHG
jgi:predicted nucleic acid-binding protein